ncbi:MAG: PrsW family intramembrane metalloprotease [Candidatus Sabulitectum sp.]|nr:PrsW family intramembrane metalloprotease [Candidatus Sabulitectum sp.]
MLPLISFVLTFLPAVLLMGYFYRRERNREPRKVLTGTFLLGVFSFLPVVLVENFLSSLNVLSHANPLFFNLYDMFANVAVPEESFKLLVIILYSARTAAFDEPMDGIVYGVAAALGFATVENIFYVLEGGFGTALTRAILSVPSHAFWGAILGYSVGQFYFKGRRRTVILLGLFVSVSLHAFFNFLLVTVEGAAAYTDTIAGFLILAMLYLLFIVFALEIVWILRTVRRLRREQEQIAQKEIH